MEDTRARSNREKKSKISATNVNKKSARKETKTRPGKVVKPQPSSSYAELDANNASRISDTLKDFQLLSDTPISEGGHFVFKSEKDWDVDNLECPEFFSLDLNKLSAAIECFPLYELYDIKEEYFTKDQITMMQNTADEAKQKYETKFGNPISTVELPGKEIDILALLKDENIVENAESSSTESDSSTGIEDDLEALLSLKEPVQDNMPSPISLPSTSFTDVRKKEEKTIKPVDLDEWLDSVLDE